MTKYIDVTRSIFSGMERYSSDPDVKIEKFKCVTQGNSCNLLSLSLGSHTGTHIDAPKHIFQKGSAIDKLNINKFICKVLVVDIKKFFNNQKKYNFKNIEGVLFKTVKDKDFLTVKEAKVILKHKIKIVGIESLSIEISYDKSHPVHKLLLNNRIPIIEGLKLDKVSPGYYQMICLPLKIRNGDGAPARVILTDD